MSRPTPGGYAAWVSWLGAFRRGDDPSTEGLGPIDGRLGTYVEARLLDRLAVAFADRMRQWQGALGDRIVAHPPEDADQAAAMLREAADRLGPMVRLAASPLLPRSIATSMHEVLDQVREGARTALDEAWQRQLADEVVDTPGAPWAPGQRAAGSGPLVTH